MKYILNYVLPILLVGGLWSCNSDDDGPSATGNEITYVLGDVASSGVSGTAEFVEMNDGTTVITLTLTGTPADGVHPAHIHENTAVEGGGIAISLEPVNGNTGRSTTIVSETDSGTPVSYADLIAYDGYINVHLSSSELSTIVSQGDIGGNAFTGTTEIYTLSEVGASGVSGTATFAQRVNNTTLVTVLLTGTPTGGDHPMHIHSGDVANPGGIAISLTNVDGDTGLSQTNITVDNNDAITTFTDLQTYDGYINVHLSPENLGTIVAQGNIGANN